MISMITNHFYSSRNRHLTFALVLLCVVLPNLALAVNHADSVISKSFGVTTKNEPVTLYTLTNKDGMSVSIMDYGATVVKLTAPDKNGKMDDVVLGFDDLSGYLDPKKDPHFGATIGRYGNRIAKGQFTLDGQTRCTADLRVLTG